MLREHRRQRCGLRLLEDDLDAHELARDLLAQVADEAVEELERLRLVLVQRIALRIAAPADDLAQVVEGDEVLAPEMVEALQQDLLLDIGHDLGRVRLDALRVGLVGRLARRSRISSSAMPSSLAHSSTGRSRLRERTTSSFRPATSHCSA